MGQVSADSLTFDSNSAGISVSIELESPSSLYLKTSGQISIHIPQPMQASWLTLHFIKSSPIINSTSVLYINFSTQSTLLFYVLLNAATIRVFINLQNVSRENTLKSDKFYDFIKLSDSISAGFGIPIISHIVGAILHNAPLLFNLHL